MNNVEDWVDYIQGLHVREIDLSLDRVTEVYQRLRPEGYNFNIITVAGTNGKGSTCELLAAIYHAAGYSTGKYTSPHIEEFNERFSINRSNVSDQLLLKAFAKVEHARELTKLTYFEFGTLLAIELFIAQEVDIAILEVGLGGRLDAVNILPADVAIVTSISIDHTDWLGSTIAEIAAEKIAISRPNKPCVIGITEPPNAMLDYCNKHSVMSYIINQDFHVSVSKNAQNWDWQGKNKNYRDLPLPFSQLGVQLENAAIALQAIHLLQNALTVEDEAVHQGLSHANLDARCQIISESPMIVVDVAHNQASVARLADFIDSLAISGKVYALCGMLKDKQIKQSLDCLVDIVDEWNFVDINTPRGSKADFLASILESTQHSVDTRNNGDMQLNPQKFISLCYKDVSSAYISLMNRLNNVDALIVFGSFFVVSDIMPLIRSGDDTHIEYTPKINFLHSVYILMTKTNDVSSEEDADFVLKHRITGAAFLIIFAVLFLPWLLSAPSQSSETSAVSAVVNSDEASRAEIEQELLDAIENENIVEQDLEIYVSRITPLDAQTKENQTQDASNDEPVIPETSTETATAQSEVVKNETVVAEAPKAEAPKAEAPKAEAPKAEAPKAETPKQQLAETKEESQQPSSASTAPSINNVEVGWVVQVGVFTDSKGAAQVVADLKGKGFTPSTTIVDTNLGKATGTRVWLGPYAQRVEAAKSKTTLKDKTGGDGFIRAYP